MATAESRQAAREKSRKKKQRKAEKRQKVRKKSVKKKETKAVVRQEVREVSRLEKRTPGQIAREEFAAKAKKADIAKTEQQAKQARHDETTAALKAKTEVHNAEILSGNALPTLTRDAIARIKEGTLKASEATTAAVMDGTIRIKEVSLTEKIAKALGLEGISTDIALVALPLGIGGGIKSAAAKVAKLAKPTAVAKLAKVGTIGRLPPGKIIGKGDLGSVAGQISTNSATIKATTSWLEKLYSQAAKRPLAAAGIAVGVGTAAAGMALATIGSYPFAGFIKEEALQTLSFGIHSAYANGDIEGMLAAIEFQKEVLDPDVWEQLKQAIPFVNVLSNLNDFYTAATIKLAIDEKVVADMKVQMATREDEETKWARIREENLQAEKDAVIFFNEQRLKTEAKIQAAEDQDMKDDARFYRVEREKEREREKEAAEERRKLNEESQRRISEERAASEEARWKRIREEEAIQDKATVDYYNAEKKKLLQWEREAENADMKDDAAFWRKERQKQRVKESDDRIAIAEFWAAYRKRMQEFNENNRPSNLNFGLL